MIFSMALMAILGFTGASEQGQRAPLVVSVKAKPIQPINSGIELTVEVTNNSDDEFKLNRTTKSPLFTLRVINEQGLDLNKDQVAGMEKDRTNKAAPPVIFKPHQTLTYHVRLARYVGEDGKEKRITAGKYKISAHLPVVTYEGGSARVESIDSEESTVILK